MDTESISGPLRVHPANPRYFADPAGRPVYLTGSHTWNNFQDWTRGAPVFDYLGYLTFLRRNDQNHIRLWVWEQGRYAPWSPDDFRIGPMPYRRSGTPGARDGLGDKYDLDAFDDAYFARLRERVRLAGDHGIYVQILLFQGRHSLGRMGGENTNPWDGHPFHRDNNVNGIDGDPDGDGHGWESHTLQIPAITRLQEAYVRKVIDTVNDLPNLLYEIANEDDAPSKEWQYHLVGYAKGYQASKPNQHPLVQSTITGEPDEALWAGAAEAVSPWYDKYRDDPPPADGRKVLLVDTDHVYYAPGTVSWTWKTFTRGQNPHMMDDGKLERNDFGDTPYDRAMGDTHRYARRLDLARAVPRGDLTSTGYCLADPGRRYLVFQPDAGAFTLDLADRSATYATEWFDPEASEAVPGAPVRGGAEAALAAPFPGAAVLYLERRGEHGGETAPVPGRTVDGSAGGR
jgi:hypothetical protein